MESEAFHGRRLRRDRRGGIEGLPLQLMIVIIIATLGTAVLVGWMGNVQSPDSIGEVTVTPGSICTSGTVDKPIQVYVEDQDGNPLQDATVVLTGLGVAGTGTDSTGQTSTSTESGTPYGNTNDKGTVTFSGLTVRHMERGEIGFISVNVTKAGYGEDKSCRITVIG